jgi:hypothetical protein
MVLDFLNWICNQQTASSPTSSSKVSGPAAWEASKDVKPPSVSFAPNGVVADLPKVAVSITFATDMNIRTSVI